MAAARLGLSSSDILFRTRPRRAPSARAGGGRLRDAHPDPGPGHPDRAGRARPARHRPDRHRQDRGLRAAHPAPARRQGRAPAARRLPRPGAEPDARAVLADRRQLPRLRQAPRPVGRGGVRRRPARAAAQGARGRHRRARRHAGPPDGPHGRRHRPPRPRRGAGARRGRPDAGQGLPARHPQDRPGPAPAAADPVLLGHHADGDRPARRRSAARSRAGGGGAGRHHGRAGGAAGAARGAGRQARAARQAAARRGRRAARWSSPAPSTAPTGW